MSMSPESDESSDEYNSEDHYNEDHYKSSRHKRNWDYPIIKSSELNYADNGVNIIPTTTGSIDLVNDIAEGAGINDRLATKISLENFYLRGYWSTRDADYTTGLWSPTLARAMLVYDTSPNGAYPAITDILETASSLSHLNYNNRGRFYILMDEEFASPEYGYGAVTAVTTVNEYQWTSNAYQANIPANSDFWVVPEQTETIPTFTTTQNNGSLGYQVPDYVVTAPGGTGTIIASGTTLAFGDTLNTGSTTTPAQNPTVATYTVPLPSTNIDYPQITYLDPGGVRSETQWGSPIGIPKTKIINRYINLQGRPAIYNGPNDDITQIASGALYLMVISDQALANSGANFQVVYRLRYNPH